MNPIDFFIVYLAVGAPFGIYYFFTNRFHTKDRWRRLKSFLIFTFWIPYAISLLHKRWQFNKSPNTFKNYPLTFDAEREKTILLIQKKFEKIFTASETEFSIYELREIFERYIGLTLALESDEREIFPQESEIFKIGSAENIEMGARCLKRRNRKLLARHQNQARQDFLTLIEKLSDSAGTASNLEKDAIKLSEQLDDIEAIDLIKKIFTDLLQTERRTGVPNLEKDLWKTEIRKPLSAPKNLHITALKATMNSSRKG